MPIPWSNVSNSGFKGGFMVLLGYNPDKISQYTKYVHFLGCAKMPYFDPIIGVFLVEWVGC